MSEGRYQSLNLGRRWGDEPRHVSENYQRVAEAGGFELSQLQLVRQVHGRELVRAPGLAPGTEADGIWLHRDQGPATVAVLTADCVPLLLADAAGSVVAAIHSGWRGTVANIAGYAVDTLVKEAGLRRGDLFAAIGPCIEQQAFEVGAEVADQFDHVHVRWEDQAKPHVDLVGCVRQQLEDAGLPPKQIERVGGCTHANQELYFSFRRDGAGIGQQLSFIGL